MNTSDLTQLMAALGALVTALGGIAALIGSRMSKRTRSLQGQVRILQRYAEDVSRWGFRVRLIMLQSGLDAPPMPEFPADPDPKDTPDEPQPAAGPAHSLRSDRVVRPPAYPNRINDGYGSLADTQPRPVYRRPVQPSNPAAAGAAAFVHEPPAPRGYPDPDPLTGFPPSGTY